MPTTWLLRGRDKLQTILRTATNDEFHYECRNYADLNVSEIILLASLASNFQMINRQLIYQFLRFSEEDIQAKVDAYRSKLMGTSQNGNEAATKDEHGRIM